MNLILLSMHDSLYTYITAPNSTVPPKNLITTAISRKKAEETYMEQEGCSSNSTSSSIRRFRELIARSKQTPDHPPYSEMILKAIESLNNEEEGNLINKGHISAYIKPEFHDLPWARESLLSHHLGKLILRGQVQTSSTGSYRHPKPKT